MSTRPRRCGRLGVPGTRSSMALVAAARLRDSEAAAWLIVVAAGIGTFRAIGSRLRRPERARQVLSQAIRGLLPADPPVPQ